GPRQLLAAWELFGTQNYLERFPEVLLESKAGGRDGATQALPVVGRLSDCKPYPEVVARFRSSGHWLSRGRHRAWTGQNAHAVPIDALMANAGHWYRWHKE